MEKFFDALMPLAWGILGAAIFAVFFWAIV